MPNIFEVITTRSSLIILSMFLIAACKPQFALQESPANDGASVLLDCGDDCQFDDIREVPPTPGFVDDLTEEDRNNTVPDFVDNSPNDGPVPDDDPDNGPQSGDDNTAGNPPVPDDDTDDNTPVPDDDDTANNPPVPDDDDTLESEVEASYSRACTPGELPAVYSGKPDFSAQEPVFRISRVLERDQSLLINGRYLTKEQVVARDIIFESPVINRTPEGKFPALDGNGFTFSIPLEVYNTIKGPDEGTFRYVVTVEEKDFRQFTSYRGLFSHEVYTETGNLIFGSSRGSISFGMFGTTTPPEGSTQVQFAVDNLPPLTFHIALMYRSAFARTTLTRENGCESVVDPLVIDFKGGQIRATAPSLQFDIFGIGEATNIGWLAPSESIGILAFDRNKNGIIDNGRELFSNLVPMDNGFATNGFETLKLYDQKEFGGNSDRVIDKRDAIFDELLIWFDRNGNAKSDTGEIVAAREAGVKAIDLNYVAFKRVDQYGNQIMGYSQVRLKNNSIVGIYDLWFVHK